MLAQGPSKSQIIVISFDIVMMPDYCQKVVLQFINTCRRRYTISFASAQIALACGDRESMLELEVRRH